MASLSAASAIVLRKDLPVPMNGKRTESLFVSLRQSGPVLRSCLSNGLGIQHKLLWIVAQALAVRPPQSKGLAATDPSFCQGLPRETGDRTDFVPRFPQSLWWRSDPGVGRRSDVLGALAGLDDSDDDDSSSTISSPLASVDGYVRESFTSANRFFQGSCPDQPSNPASPSPPAGQEGIPCLQEW
ncbi:hypothetical protein GWK47_011116 [Chionoecetes opilio]|uniref:Uncharacterized protein n=1 Tax=Chionoecetes opilio TaxID=41210 RepID=A0A8J4Y230_CHIOP|nr:hypothetical protein GWK47_011116 [Chionoecetes opilio]